MKSRIQIKRICILLAVLIATGFQTFSGYSEPEIGQVDQESEYADTADTLPDSFSERVYDDERFSISIDRETADFAVCDKESGAVYTALPPDRFEDFIAKGINRTLLQSVLAISYYDSKTQQVGTANCFVDCLGENGLTVRLMKKGVEFDFTFASLDLMVPLQVQVIDGTLSLKIPADKIEENGNYRLLDVTVAPFFAAGKISDEGYLLIPDGSGALIDFNNGKTAGNPYTAYVYGADLTDTISQSVIANETVRLPVFGMKRNETGFLAMIVSGAAQAKITADISGASSSYNHVFTTFEWRKSGGYTLEGGWQSDQSFLVFQKQAPSLAAMEIRFHLLPKGCGLTDMAAAVRNHLTGLGLVKTQEPGGAVLSFLGAVQKQTSILGVPVQVQRPVTTIDEMSSIVDGLSKQDIGIGAVRYLAWNNREIKGGIVKSAGISSVLGSSRSWKAFAEKARQQEIGFFPSVCFSQYRSGGFPFSSYFNSVRNVDGSVTGVQRYAYNTGQAVQARELKLHNAKNLSANVTTFLKKFSKLPADGLDVGDLGVLNYSDFSGTATEREALSGIVFTLLEKAKIASGALMLSEPNAYALPLLDWAVNIPEKSSELVIANESVPFYQMCISGYVNYCTRPINLEHSPEDALLNALKTGSYPHFMLGANPSKSMLENTDYEHCIGIDYASVKPELIRLMERFCQAAGQLGDYTITDFKTLFNGVTKTTYNNGAAVFVNLTGQSFTQGNLQVEPHGFLIVKEAVE